MRLGMVVAEQLMRLCFTAVDVFGLDFEPLIGSEFAKGYNLEFYK